MKAAVYTLIALIAFAGNSLLCKIALTKGYIDAYNFTSLRLLSGAVCLGVIMSLYNYNLKRKGHLGASVLNEKGSWLSSLSLFVYACCFSVAYVKLDTGTGALILFSAVQLTMISWGIVKKEQLSYLQWGAFFVALGAFGYLMIPSTEVPSFTGAFLMTLSGLAWGIYSIRGKTCISPLRTTSFNFIRSLVGLPLLLLLGMSYFSNVSIKGGLLACASGAIASGIGYSIWYVAMPLLKSTHAAVVQLSVPILAAIGGVIFLAEEITIKFATISLLILGSIFVFITSKKKV